MKLAKPKLSRPRWQKVLLRFSVLAMLACALGAALSVYKQRTDPEQVRKQVEAYLQRFVYGTVSVGSAEFSWLRGIVLHDVTISESPGYLIVEKEDKVSNEAAENFFSCREARLAYDPIATLFGRREIEAITVVDPTFVVTHYVDDDITSLSGLLRPNRKAFPISNSNLPIVEVLNARFRVVHREGQDTRVVEDLSMAIRGRQSDRDPRFYELVWRGLGDREGGGHLQIDLQTGGVRNVAGGLPWLSIEGVLAVVPFEYLEAGGWREFLGVQGMVRVDDYSLDAGSQPKANIEFKNVAFSIPAGGKELPPSHDARYLSFEQVSGSIELTSEGLTAGFEGTLHGAACTVSAKLFGDTDDLASLDAAAFDLSISVDGIQLPRSDPGASAEEKRFVQRWKKLAKFFRTYDPHGKVDLQLSLKKPAGQGAKLAVESLSVVARGGDASCRFFPYRLHNLAGRVEMLPSGIFLRALRGEHANGRVTVDGWVSAPKRTAAAELTITGAAVPIDQTLYDGLSEKYRRFIDQLSPRGHCDVEVTLSRPESSDNTPAPWESRAALSFRTLEASYSGFPYLLSDISGLLVIEHNVLEAIDVKGRAGKGTFTLSGSTGLSAPGPSDLQLNLAGTGVTIDEDLLAAIPDRLKSELELFHPSGSVDFDLTLSRPLPGGDLEYDLDVMLNAVAIKHADFPVPIEDIHGRISITAEDMTLRNVSGRYREADISASGSVGLTAEDRTTDLAIQCQNLRLDDTIQDAVPARLRAVLEQWHIEQPIEINIAVQNPAPGTTAEPNIRTVALLDDVTVWSAGFPSPFEHVRGRIEVDNSGARAKGIEARYRDADLLLDFESVANGSAEEGFISLKATGVSLDDSTRDVLPTKLRRIWDRIQPEGTVDLSIGRLEYRNIGDGNVREWSVDGQVSLREVSLAGAAELGIKSGTVTIAGLLVDRSGGAALKGNAVVESATVLGHPLLDVETPWTYTQTDETGGRLVLGPLSGNIYDGSLAADLELVTRDSATEYNLRATIHAMDIHPYLSVARDGENPPAEPVNARGFADGRVFLSGVLGDSKTRRGGGRVEIRDGHMYRLPIMLAILNVINLAVPEDDAFHNAQSDFHVVGNNVVLRDLLLRGNALALSGYGSISMPQRSVDLYLVNVSPHSWVRLPGIGDFMEGASRNLVELHVTGQLSRPTVRAKPLRSVAEELKRLFKKKKPKTVITAGT